MKQGINQEVARQLRRGADLLEQAEASRFRVAAYRRAAAVVAGLANDVDSLLRDEGRGGLQRIRGIGSGTSAAIEEIVETGRWSLLDQLERGRDPERLFQSLPGVGPELARKIHESLGAGTLEELEVAAHDGRLEAVPGVGAKRARSIRLALEAILRRSTRLRAAARAQPASKDEPSVSQLLDVDQEYRERARAGVLPRIAPRRFNPRGEAWLPILRTRRGDWRFTALFSNTALAHRLDRVQDWVVIYYSRPDLKAERQVTVATETQAPLDGKRVVRGRELECLEHYERERRRKVA